MKLSPLSVPYRVLQRGGSVLAAAAFFLFSGGASLPFGLAGPAAVVVLLGLAVLALTAYEVAYYRRYEYELTPDTLDIASGVFARRDREIPLRRVQTVDISRNVVQRVLGIASVDFETAGGDETEAAIRFVSYEEAKRLQREVARLKRGADDEQRGTDAELLFELSRRELALVGALSFDLRGAGVVFVLVSTFGTVLSSLVPSGIGRAIVVGSVVAMVFVVLVLSWAVGAALAVVNYYGFRLWRAGDELQYERGLFRRYDGSIPLDKVQTLTVQDTPPKRWFGYATLNIETAGYTPGGDGTRGAESAVPLARRERVTRLANDIEAFGDPEFQRPPRRVRRRYAVRYLLALGVVLGLTYGLDRLLPELFTVPWYAPAAAALLIPLAAHYKWLHRGYWLGPEHVVTRNGVFDRKTKVVPYYRIQTVIDSETLFQRRWRLATVTIDTAGSRSITGGHAAAVDVDRETATRLRRTLTDRLQDALAGRRSQAEATGVDGTDERAGRDATGDERSVDGDGRPGSGEEPPQLEDGRPVSADEQVAAGDDLPGTSRTGTEPNGDEAVDDGSDEAVDDGSDGDR